MTENKPKAINHYIIRYTGMFAIFCLCAFLVFWVTGRSFIWETDGQAQYVIYLDYMGSYIREFLGQILKGNFGHRMFDFTIGWGADVSLIFRSHPLDFLSALVPSAYTEVLYHGISLLRMYLAGLCFARFALYMKMPADALLPASFLYLSGGFLLYQGVQHPTYLSVLIILPLLLHAAERALRKEGVLEFSLTVFLGFMANYYFMYMCTILMAVYVVVRFFMLYGKEKDWYKHLGGLFVRMVGAYLLGTAMSMATLLPTAMQLRLSSRLGSVDTKPANFFSYSKGFLRQVLVDLIVPGRVSGNLTNLNYLVVLLPALGVVYTRRRKYTFLKWIYPVTLVCLTLPLAGYVMTGFSNPTNRWDFVMAFLSGLMLSAAWKDLLDPDKRAIKGILTADGIWMVLAVMDYRQNRSVDVIFAAVMLVGVTGLILILPRIKALKPQTGRILALACVLNLLVNGVVLYSSKFYDYSGTFVMRGRGLNAVTESGQKSLSELFEDESFYRFETGDMSYGKENYPITLGLKGLAIYNSTLGSSQTQYLLELENSGLNAVHRIFGVDGITAALEVANVKYEQVNAAYPQTVPYGYQKLEGYSQVRKGADGKEKQLDVYENTMPLSFGASTDKYMLRSDYLKLSSAERAQMAIYCAVVDDDLEEQMQSAGLTRLTKCPVQVEKETVSLTAAENAAVTEGGLNVTADEGTFAFIYQKKAGYETYIRFENLTTPLRLAEVTLTAEGFKKNLALRGAGPYAPDRSDYLVNLGYSDTDEEQTVTITFASAGTYTCSGAQIFRVPMEGYEAAVQEMNETHLTDTAFEANAVSGKISLTSARVLVCSVPYSAGWTAFVDGEETQILQTDTAWSGILIPAGDHEVTLRYVSPGSPLGRTAAACGWILFLGLYICGRIRKQKKGRA